MVYFRSYVILDLRKTCVSVYFSLFYSHVLYGCMVWSYSTQRNIDGIIKLQKRCIRIITYSEFIEHTGPLFSELNTAQKMKFFIKDFFSKCDQIHRKSLMESFIFCAVKNIES